jgi:PAS domain S-box-containing protein
MNCNSLILKEVAENSGAGIIVFNDNSVITACNSMSEEVFGQSEGELIGCSLAELDVKVVDMNGHPEQKRGFPNNKISSHQQQPVQFDFGLQVPSLENIRWFRANLQPILTGSKKLSSLILSLIEITDLVAEKKTRDQIFLAKSEWETTVDALQDIVTIQDMQWRIVRANKKAHELFGYALGKLKGELCYEIFHNKSHPCEECPAKLTSKDHSSHIGTIYNHILDRTFNVSSFPIFDRDGNMCQFVHVARDITQSLLDESEKNRLMAAIEQASESVIIASRNREIQYVNPAFEVITGYGRDEVIGKNPNFSGVHDQQFYDSMWEILVNKQVWRGRLTNRKKDGNLVKEDATISAVLDNSGEIINYVALKRDVTREEILEQQLRQRMKMEALGTLAGGIAHDFNNILSAMLGYAEIAKARLSVDHPAKKDLDHVIASGDRAVDLVKQITTFSKRESYGQFRLFKLQYIIEEVSKLLRPSLPSTIELKHEIDSSCRSIFADSGQMYQVLLNLCTNARQAIGKEYGCITLKLTEVKPADLVIEEIFLQESETILNLEVSDTGCGIEKDMLDKIFDPFFTTRKKEQGTGLGLAVVHGIIKKHKGEISITSKVGVGTSVHVYLSADGGEVDSPKTKTKSFIKPNSCCKERIMIIDDEAPVTDILRLRLSKEGYKVTIFNDSIAAVTHFRMHPDCCDLVITDMLMPEMTGAELAREFTGLRSDIPIILLTGHCDHLDKKRVRQLGVRELLLKPVNKEELSQVIRKVLDHG